MHFKVVVVVSRSHWRCVSCKLTNKRMVSIDQHLQSSHPHLASSSSSDTHTTNLDHMCCHSDDELDSVFQNKELFPLGHHKSLSLENKKNQLLKKEPRPQISVVTESPAVFEHRRQTRNNTRKLTLTHTVTKRNSTRKPALTHTVTNNHNEGCVEEPDTKSHTVCKDSDKNCLGDDGNVNSDEHEEAVEEATACKKKTQTQRKPQASPKKKSAPLQVAQCLNSRRQKGSRKSSTVKTTVKDELETNNFHISNKVKVVASRKRTNKTTEQTDFQIEEDCEKPESTDVKEETPVHYAEMQTAGIFKAEKHLKVKRLNVTNLPKKGKYMKEKHVKVEAEHDARKKSSKQIDKSQIATCCVPWLLDSGRKAGEKVTKTSRRALLPEEKQAVRELYGINLYNQTANVQAMNVANGTDGQFDMQTRSVNVEENYASYQSSLTPVQKITQEEDTVATHRCFLVNLFSQGTRDFFIDSSRTQEDLYPSYGGMYSQHQNQHSHCASQASEFYNSAHNIPSQTQRSDLMNFQPYNQTEPPGLTTASVGDTSRQVMDVGDYSGQGCNLPNFLQPQTLPASMVSGPPPVPTTNLSLTTSSYDVNADPTGPVPHSVTSASQSSTIDDFSIKPDPTSLQRADIATPVFPSVTEETTSVDGTTDNQHKACKQTFQSTRTFEKQQGEVSSFESVECKRCRSVFHGLYELNLHVFSVHETEKQAFCFTCNEDLTGMENLEKHVHKHAYDCEHQLGEMRFHDCRLCNEELPNSYTTIRIHYYQHHVAHVCSECYRFFTDIHSYREHSKIHNGKPILCSICGAKHESVEDFDQHAPCSEDIWAEDGKGDQCFKCGLWCPNRAVVEAHRKQHRSQDDVEAYRQGAKIGFPCASCEKVFKNKHACRRHIKMVHEGVSCYKHYCEYCGKGFLTKGHMRDHIALHHLKIKRYRCDYCNQQFVCAPTLRRHVRKEHTKHKPYECQHCGERFFEKTPLQRHLTQHTGLAPFMCEHCGKGFYTKHSFTNHGSTHSSVKDFVCTGCQKGFTRKYNLQAHLKICKRL